MIKNSSETKSDLTCEECGEPIKQNQIDNKPIYCEFCGALHSSVDTQHPEKIQLEQERIKFSYTTEELSQEIRNLTYQKIYELLKANFSIMRRLKHQEDLKQSQILKLAKKLRKALLSLSLPSNSTELLTNASKKKIENYFADFQASLKKKKKNRSNYMPYLIKNIKFIYGLINGDYEFSALAKYNQKAVKKLKMKYGFKINNKTKNSFSYFLSILLSRKIYRIITAPGQVLDLKHSKNELTKQYTLNTAKDITALVINNYFKRNFSKAYRKLKRNLEIDWVYRESFIDHVCSLIKLTYRLAYNKGYSSKLRGFQKLIAQDLKESAFFEDDINFSPYLKLNLTLILSRIIHNILDSSQNLTPLQSDPRKLNPTDNLRLATEILDEILEDKKIKSEFLKTFYNLSIEEFQKEYAKLQVKLKSDMLYKENFLSFLQKLINSVYKITHTRTKKSNHSRIELGIIKDLANYNFNWESIKKEKSCFYSEEKNKRYDIFTTKIPENSPLWRVRAYVIGFLLADGSIFIYKKTNSHQIYASQHKRDKDILEIVQKALGGNITGPNPKKRFRLEFSNKQLYKKLKEFGMRERHTYYDVAVNLLPPQFIQKKINGVSLIRDFVRGFFDGDGCFSGNYKNYSLRYQILGPTQFLTKLKEFILSEIPSLTAFITPRREKIYKKGNKEYQIYSQYKIYIKGKGFRKLTSKDLNEGLVFKREHPWLSVLHFTGALNSIKFFNWLYCNDDNFQNYKISGIPICGKRKFNKALEALGNSDLRKTKLAPNWKDILYDVISSLDDRYYKSKDLMKLTNSVFSKKLNNMGLGHVVAQKKINDLDYFIFRLKHLEYREDIIGHYRRKEGRVYRNYYYSKINPPNNLPPNFHKYIDLIKKDGSLKKNIKNYIISIFIFENKWRRFKEIYNNIMNSKKFTKVIAPIRVELYLMELFSFDIILINNENLKLNNQKFKLNCSILPEYYNIDINQLKSKMKVFLK